ncbi:zinc dependent phospholipase C family protein [Geobacter grbiciae]|uniref:zinc dependent phospholipase C family protein n=1 Tax=Geobacter grbiciae TaxID=155042 RepID=UPI001C01B1ED|nr:zinc dependent phospholipase C family protein [Geobacter grbiciae]MBT1075610.1 zinc dependent phospholipase C family protein [Geobacter grbiciae]
MIPMPILPIFLLIILFVPANAFAWGAGIHLQLGTAVINNLQAVSPAVAAVVGAFPHDFLYGCIAADITLGKKFTHYLQHCHRWRIGMKVLEYAWNPPQKACAYGYLAHLAADTVAHNYYVPAKTMESFSTLTLKHAYWEMRLETYVDQEIWETGKKVATENYKANDALLRNVLSDTLFSFGTNKRIFNSILLVSRLEKWQQVLKTLSDTSRYTLEEDDRSEYLDLAEEAVFDFLNRLEESRYFQADPTGERALATAEAVRKNLRLLYNAGKITKEDAVAQVDSMRIRLREAICEPDKLLQIMSRG